MTDKDQQRERFEAEWERHNSTIEPHEMIRYGMTKAIAFRYWQAALSQPTVAGAVDECNHDWRVMDWQEAYPASTGRVCKKCDITDLGWLGHDVSRTASPSQPTAEGDDDDTPLLREMDDLSLRLLLTSAADRIEETEPDVSTDLLNAMQEIIRLRHASPADDGEESAWQPIETAPKDGTEIQLACEGRVTAGHWQVVPPEQVGDCGGECRCPEYDEPVHPDFWLSLDGGFTQENSPTHWQPLSAPLRQQDKQS